MGAVQMRATAMYERDTPESYVREMGFLSNADLQAHIDAMDARMERDGCDHNVDVNAARTIVLVARFDIEGKTYEMPWGALADGGRVLLRGDAFEDFLKVFIDHETERMLSQLRGDQRWLPNVKSKRLLDEELPIPDAIRKAFEIE